jgi:ribonuclease G
LLDIAHIEIMQDGDNLHLAAFSASSLILEYRVFDPWSKKLGSLVAGRVKSITDQGIFIDIGKEIAYLSSPKRAYHEGEKILVRLVKGAGGGKYVELSDIAQLHGEYFIYEPGHKLSFSRQLNDGDRGRIKNIRFTGGIVRTKAKQASNEQLVAEKLQLEKWWQNIEHDFADAKIGDVLYKVDRLKQYLDECINLEAITHGGGNSLVEVKAYADARQLKFTYDHALEIDIEFDKYINLQKGGSIIIEELETLTAIDVNLTDGDVVACNMAAAQEIVYQLRLRNIGGIILIDFLRMKKQKNRDSILAQLKKATKYDRAVPQILGFTRGGLVEIIRKNDRMRHKGV